MKHFKSVFAFLVSYVLILDASFSQTAPAIEWQNTIGGDTSDFLYCVQQTLDGGYILGGWSSSNISGDKTENSVGYYDYWIVKTDSSGVIQWQNTIGGNDGDILYCVQQTFDGGYILGGYSYSNISGNKTENSNGAADYWVVKTDASGSIQWQNTIGGIDNDYLFSIQQTVDGGYILGGRSESIISGDKTENNTDTVPPYTCDYWIVKINAAGNTEWQNTIGGNTEDWLYCIQQTADSGYILGGSSRSTISGDKTENCIGNFDYWIVKTDASGNIQWENTIGGNDLDMLWSVQQTTEEEYIIGGYSLSDISGDKYENSIGLSDYWIVKIDSLGNLKWQNTIGGNSFDELYSIQQTADGGYILGGSSRSNISGDKTENCIGWSDFWTVKTDSSGNIQWQNTIGGNSYDELYSIQQTNDNGYIFGGRSASNISGDKTENCIGLDDYWIVKLAPDTVTGITNSPLDRGKGCVIFPNPADEYSVIGYQFGVGDEILLTDALGKILFTKAFSSLTSNFTLHTSNYGNGIYFLQLKTNEGMAVKKLVVQR